jgi:hypothetical protein
VLSKFNVIFEQDFGLMAILINEIPTRFFEELVDLDPCLGFFKIPQWEGNGSVNYTTGRNLR